MIIAVSGKIGSGKDTIGRIIQYLSWRANVDSSKLLEFEEWNEKVPSPCPVGSYQLFEIKKFADKLKEICSLLTGIPKEDFEKQSVKDSYLPEEWVKYGVDGDHDFTPEDYGFVSSYEEAVELANTVGENPKFIQKYRMTVRDLLQQVGTNAMRNIIHPNIWVNALFTDYKSNWTEGTKDYWKEKMSERPNWVITDARFPNEVEIVEKKGGIVIRVERPVDQSEKDSCTCEDCGAGFSIALTDDSNGLSPCCKNHNYKSNYKEPSKHLSETALDKYPFKHVIVNDGTLKDLVYKVQDVLTKEKHNFKILNT